MFVYGLYFEYICNTFNEKIKNNYFMRKFYTAFALMFTCATVWANCPATTSVMAARNNTKTVSKLESALPDASTVIDKQPEGTLYENMYHSANVYVVYGNSTSNRLYDGYVGNVVVSADGKKIYMKDPFIKLAPGTWLEGDLSEDGTAEFKFPQVIYNKGGVVGYAWKLTIANSNIAPDQTTQSVKFNWDGKTLSQQTSTDLIGMLNENNEWMGYGASQSNYSVMTDVVAKPDDESKAATYRMTYYNEEGGMMTASTRVVVDGSDIYIGGIFGKDLWIKGTVNGSKATFSTQYMGVYSNASHAYMMPFDADSYNVASTLEFSYNATTGKLSTDKAILINLGKTRLSALGMYISPSLSKVNYTVEAPATPVILQCSPVGYEGGDYGVIVYKLSTSSVSGKQLDQDNIYYNIYLDDELQTFTTSKYSYIKNDITDVPYQFSDSYVNPMSGSHGMDLIADNGQQVIFIYKKYSKLGVKAFYLDGDKKYESALAEKTVTTGIDNAVAEGQEVESTVYTDLNGARVAVPTHGVYLKTVTYKNGEKKTVKVLK